MSFDGIHNTGTESYEELMNLSADTSEGAVQISIIVSSVVLVVTVVTLSILFGCGIVLCCSCCCSCCVTCEQRSCSDLCNRSDENCKGCKKCCNNCWNRGKRNDDNDADSSVFDNDNE